MRVDGSDGESGPPATASRPFDRVARAPVYVPLGTHANKQGRVLGTNLAGGDVVFPGVVRTAISKVCDLEVARTGMREKDAQRAGLDSSRRPLSRRPGPATFREPSR